VGKKGLGAVLQPEAEGRRRFWDKERGCSKRNRDKEIGHFSIVLNGAGRGRAEIYCW